jgi:hypothetical protein
MQRCSACGAASVTKVSLGLQTIAAHQLDAGLPHPFDRFDTLVDPY